LQLGERRQRRRRILNLPVILLLEGSLPKAGGGSMTPVKDPRSGLQLVRPLERLRGCEPDAAATASKNAVLSSTRATAISMATPASILSPPNRMPAFVVHFVRALPRDRPHVTVCG
jgi:hypothetical protein